MHVITGDALLAFRRDLDSTNNIRATLNSLVGRIIPGVCKLVQRYKNMAKNFLVFFGNDGRFEKTPTGYLFTVEGKYLWKLETKEQLP